MNKSYTDLHGNVLYLTESELTWFKSVCDKCIKATRINISIECDNHELTYKGTKGSEALGILITDSPKNPLDGNLKITIDTYFIHECYEEKFNNGFNLNFESLEHVIAHELAHTIQWRHCKRHTRITEELYNKIMEYSD